MQSSNVSAPKRRVRYSGLRTYLGDAFPMGTLRGWVSKGVIPHYRVSGRLVLFDLDEIDQWLAKHAVASKAG